MLHHTSVPDACLHAGFNVILVSRTESKLKDVATDIEARYGVQTKVVPADFATMDDATWEALEAVLGSVPLGVLINSAGRPQQCVAGSIVYQREPIIRCSPTAAGQGSALHSSRVETGVQDLTMNERTSSRAVL